MIDILRQRSFFPLRDFGDVERLFEFNLDCKNGEPNLALLSIVVGLIEHSLVTVTDKDLEINSRPINQPKDHVQQKFWSNKLVNSSCSSHHLSSTSNELNKDSTQSHDCHPGNSEFNEAAYDSSNSSDGSTSPTANDNLIIPEIEFEVVETLYKKFVEQFKGSIDFKDVEVHKTNLKIKKISDSVWEHLSNSYYKDKAHLQSIFSYLTTSKLDCFGLAFAVLAGCQILNLKNIYLALSEDHAWVMFDLRPDEFKLQKEKELKEYIENNLPVPTCALHGTCEVTWHGKANSDKRGQPVSYKNCWLYTNGYAVKCDIKLCVAALVNSINPSINTNTESEVLALLQQRLLWLLFKQNNYFPMSLGNLGELENVCPTPNAPLTPHELFNLGIEISRNQYNNSHVYPYSYLASYFLNHGRFKEALETWADASAVMTKYNYSRDDEQIYNEFREIANDLIPSLFKVLTAGGLEPGKVSTKPFLQDPECLALILKFYDNICCWEEGSSTPVLHITWSKSFMATILKFSFVVRSKIQLLTEDEWTKAKANASECEVSSRADQCSSTAIDKAEIKDADSQHSEVESRDARRRPNDGCKSRKRAHSFDDKVGTSDGLTGKIKMEDSMNSTEASSGDSYARVSPKQPYREQRLVEVDGDNNVTVILKSRKIAGMRDLLKASNLNKTTIELQLTAQSQCAVRGRSNSSSHSSDFISTALTSMGGSTRSKRLQR